MGRYDSMTLARMATRRTSPTGSLPSRASSRSGWVGPTPGGPTSDVDIFVMTCDAGCHRRIAALRPIGWADLVNNFAVNDFAVNDDAVNNGTVAVMRIPSYGR